MTEFKIPDAHSDKDRDVPEILPMCALPGLVLGGMLGFYLGDTVGAILGAIAGGGAGAGIAYWVLNNSGPVAKKMDTQKTEE